MNFPLWVIWGFCALLTYECARDVIKCRPSHFAEHNKTGRIILFAVTTTYVIGLPLAFFL